MILVFDSGVGGLSVAREIRQQQPARQIHYLMDTAFFPYGIREDDALRRRIVSVCRQACAKIDAKLLVIACNTASTLALEQLRSVLDIPVVGVVPAIKTAARYTVSGRIGLLATAATVRRPYTDDLIEQHASHCHVARLGSSELVTLAENTVLAGARSASHAAVPLQHRRHQLQKQLQQLLGEWLAQHQPDQVVLGCTHFPLLKADLSALWPDIGWVDSGMAVANRVTDLLAKAEKPATGGLRVHHTGAGEQARTWQLNLSEIWPDGDEIMIDPPSSPWVEPEISNNS